MPDDSQRGESKGVSSPGWDATPFSTPCQVRATSASHCKTRGEGASARPRGSPLGRPRGGFGPLLPPAGSWSPPRRCCGPAPCTALRRGGGGERTGSTRVCTGPGSPRGWVRSPSHTRVHNAHLCSHPPPPQALTKDGLQLHEAGDEAVEVQLQPLVPVLARDGLIQLLVQVETWGEEQLDPSPPPPRQHVVQA